MPEDMRGEMLEALLEGRRLPGFENENPSLYGKPFFLSMVSLL